MSEAGAYYAKSHLPQLLDRVELGEGVIGTPHGRAFAVLAPCPTPDVQRPTRPSHNP